MTDLPYLSGDFVWSNFPERENPARPGPRHIAYVVLGTSTDQGDTVFMAYTTTRPWDDPNNTPIGVYPFDREVALTMGQRRAFTVDLRRIGAVPPTEEWFPDLDEPDRGLVGKAPEDIRRQFDAAIKDLFRRRPELIERLGPNWRG